MNAAKCIDEAPVLQPNPDISGIGVLLGFILTAYGALFCCITKAIIDHKRSTSANNTPNLDRWASALRATIVSFSDQQVITGISIIIGGLSQLKAGISVYHWLSVVNLAWFSTITHLITLTVLREEFQTNMPIKILRITGMAVLITMLICVMGPVGYLISDTNGIPNTFPAWCLYHPGIEWKSGKHLLGKRYNWLYQLFAMDLLIYSFLTRLVLLLSQSGGVGSFVFRIPVGQPWKYTEERLEKLQQRLDQTDGFSRFFSLAAIKFKVLFSIHAVFLTGNDLYQSKTWEITWLSLAIAWGTIRIDVSRSGVSSLGNPSELSQDVKLQHNLWGFGQVAAIVLLLIPIISMFGAFYSFKKEDQSQSIPLGNLPADTSGAAPPPSTSAAPHIPISEIREGLHASPWSQPLRVLWYLLSIAIGADLLYTFPANGAADNLTSEGYRGFKEQCIAYILLAVFDIAILWLPTLLFMDTDLRRKWTSWKVGKFMSKEPITTFGWGLIIICLLGLSVMFNVFLELVGSGQPGFPRLGIF